jgi:hypothetical protein
MTEMPTIAFAMDTSITGFDRASRPGPGLRDALSFAIGTVLRRGHAWAFARQPSHPWPETEARWSARAGLTAASNAGNTKNVQISV